MRKQKLYRRWKRRLRAGLESIESLLAKCLDRGKPDDIHELRVTLRRARMLACVGRTILGKTRQAEFRQWALRLTAVLGPVRDYDVIMEWVRASYPSVANDRALTRRRAQTLRLARSTVAALSRERWNELQSRGGSGKRAGKLRRGFRIERAKLQSNLGKEARRFKQLNEAALHEFRRKLRRLRYLRELQLSGSEQKKDPRLQRLIGFQEALGEMQNCVIIRKFFADDSGFKNRLQVIRMAQIKERQFRKTANKHLDWFRRALERAL